MVIEVTENLSIHILIVILVHRVRLRILIVMVKRGIRRGWKIFHGLKWGLRQSIYFVGLIEFDTIFRDRFFHLEIPFSQHCPIDSESTFLCVLHAASSDMKTRVMGSTLRTVWGKPMSLKILEHNLKSWWGSDIGIRLLLHRRRIRHLMRFNLLLDAILLT